MSKSLLLRLNEARQDVDRFSKSVAVRAAFAFGDWPPLFVGVTWSSAQTPFSRGSTSCNVLHLDGAGLPVPCPDFG